MGFTCERTGLKIRNHQSYDERQWWESSSSQTRIKLSFRPTKNLADDVVWKYNFKKKYGQRRGQLVAELSK